MTSCAAARVVDTASIRVANVTVLMIASQIHALVLLPDESDQGLHIRMEFIGKAVAWTWHVDRDHTAHPGRIPRQHDHPIGEIHRFLDAMRHIDEGLSGLTP